MKNSFQQFFNWAILVMLAFLFMNSIKQPVVIAGYTQFVVIIDVSGSMHEILPNLKKATIKFTNELPDSTFIYVATFHEEANVVFAQELHDSSRIQLNAILNGLKAEGRWTHFATALKLIQDIAQDSLAQYKVLIFTDQLSDPRPGFTDINIGAFESHLPGNAKTFIISTPQALAQLGPLDSTGFIDTQTNVTGLEVDINSSDDILDKLRLITSEKGIPDITRILFNRSQNGD
jgi:hypothetical protein